jgi:pimeloyl-ACP methyl ester carboxylesterase
VANLVLVHAFPVDASMWDEQVAALGNEVEQMVAPNLPGFGGTPGVGDVMRMEAAADHVVAEMDRAGIDRAAVVGVSMGGYVAFAMWARNRDRFAALGLADSRAEPDDDAGRERRRQVAEKARTEGSGAIAESPPPLLSEGADPALWDRVREMIRRQPGESIAAASLGLGERADARPLLAGIDVPTTVIVGSADTLTPPPMSEAMAEAIPGAELVVLDGAGHLSNLEDPQGFTDAARSLLRRA